MSSPDSSSDVEVYYVRGRSDSRVTFEAEICKYSRMGNKIDIKNPLIPFVGKMLSFRLTGIAIDII